MQTNKKRHIARLLVTFIVGLPTIASNFLQFVMCFQESCVGVEMVNLLNEQLGKSRASPKFISLASFLPCSGEPQAWSIFLILNIKTCTVLCKQMYLGICECVSKRIVEGGVIRVGGMIRVGVIRVL